MFDEYNFKNIYWCFTLFGINLRIKAEDSLTT